MSETMTWAHCPYSLTRSGAVNNIQEPLHYPYPESDPRTAETTECSLMLWIDVSANFGDPSLTRIYQPVIVPDDWLGKLLREQERRTK